MRTAMPFSTWLRITDRWKSATSLESSRPRLIGPGCITMASGLARSMCSSCRPILAGFTRLEMGVAQGLPELVELPVVNSQLVQDSVGEGRTDLPSTVNWDRGGASVWMPPSFVAPGLARLQKTEPGCGAAEFVSSS